MPEGYSIKTMAMLAVSLLVAAVMIPIAMQQIVGTPTTVTGNATAIWNGAVVTMWQVLLPVLVLISIAILFLPQIRGKGN